MFRPHENEKPAFSNNSGLKRVFEKLRFRISMIVNGRPNPGGVTPYNGLYEEAPPDRGTFFSLQVYKRVGISQVEVYKKVRKSVI